MKTLTHELLVSKGACSEDRKRFRRKFPKGMRVTLKNCEVLAMWRVYRDGGGRMVKSRRGEDRSFAWKFANCFYVGEIDLLTLPITNNEIKWASDTITKSVYITRTARIVYDVLRGKV